MICNSIAKNHITKSRRMFDRERYLSQLSRNVLIERSRNVLVKDSGLDRRGQARDGQAERDRLNVLHETGNDRIMQKQASQGHVNGLWQCGIA